MTSAGPGSTPHDSLSPRTGRLRAPTGQSFIDRARSRATISNVLTGAGMALMTAGVILYVTAPDHSPEQQAHTIVPIASPDGIGLSIHSSF